MKLYILFSTLTFSALAAAGYDDYLNLIRRDSYLPVISSRSADEFGDYQNTLAARDPKFSLKGFGKRMGKVTGKDASTAVKATGVKGKGKGLGSVVSKTVGSAVSKGVGASSKVASKAASKSVLKGAGGVFGSKGMRRGMNAALAQAGQRPKRPASPSGPSNSGGYSPPPSNSSPPSQSSSSSGDSGSSAAASAAADTQHSADVATAASMTSAATSMMMRRRDMEWSSSVLGRRNQLSRRALRTDF